MAASILSVDILSLCLLKCGGNTELQLEEIILRIENYQEMNERHFGLTRSDFRCLFLNLIQFQPEGKNVFEELNEIKLRNVLIEILSYRDAYFNDEGSYWCEETITPYRNPDFNFVKYWYGYNESEYLDKLALKHNMIDFFKNQISNPINSGLVNEFMKRTKITDKILTTCSRPGKSS